MVDTREHVDHAGRAVRKDTDLSGLVTLFTDASFDHERQVAGWGYWARDADRSDEGGGMLMGTVQTVGAAELRAVVEAVRRLAGQGMFERNHRLLVKVDNLAVVETLSGIREHGGLGNPFYRAELDELIRANDLAAWFRHVKGHVSGRDRSARHWANGRADFHARRHLRDYVAGPRFRREDS